MNISNRERFKAIARFQRPGDLFTADMVYEGTDHGGKAWSISLGPALPSCLQHRSAATLREILRFSGAFPAG